MARDANVIMPNENKQVFIPVGTDLNAGSRIVYNNSFIMNMDMYNEMRAGITTRWHYVVRECFGENLCIGMVMM